MHTLHIEPGILTPSMRLLNEKYRFDTMAARQACLNQANLPMGSRVLDVGTSSGWMAIVLAAASHRVVAIDSDRDTLERARRLANQICADLAEKIDFVPADVGAMPFEDDSFDGVFSFESLHHFPACSTALQEMYRVCRPGGAVTIADLDADGLCVVRECLQDLTGQRHEENPCRLVTLEHLLQKWGTVERHDILCPYPKSLSVKGNK